MVAIMTLFILFIKQSKKKKTIVHKVEMIVFVEC